MPQSPSTPLEATVREERGKAQIFFSFLPGQTVDLEGRVWKVREWVDARELAVDQRALRQTIASAAKPWEGLDDGLNQVLRTNQKMDVRQVDENRGVLVDRYPEIYRCKSCGRITNKDSGTCKCGHRERAQLHFVAFHECGRLEIPGLPKCFKHDATAMKLPGTTRTNEIVFSCPDCRKHIAKGFLRTPCDCGITGEENDAMGIQVHRAGVVYTPRFATLVNSTDPDVNAELRARGGDVRALDWFIDGMVTDRPEERVKSEESYRARLAGMQLSPDAIEGAVQAALASGDITPAGAEDVEELAGPRAQAGQQALSLASAVASGARLPVSQLDPGTSPNLKHRYEHSYPEALTRAGFTDVSLLEDFPVVNVAFGYTRGSPTPGKSRLRSFRHLGQPRVYGLLTETEALLFQIDPQRILAWLAARGHDVATGDSADASAARKQLTHLTTTPRPFEDVEGIGGDVLTLVHSISHRAVRTLATFAGTDRDALGEYLLPNLGAFVVYGTGGGTFDLGGLRSVLESTLDMFLDSFVGSESRCPLDPGCVRANAACMACLHLGERSCERFNGALSRTVMFGADGFLSG